MPLYEYQCEACGKRFEMIRKFSDPPLEACSQSGASPVRRLQSSPAIQFKGSGWYITDYSDKGKAASGSEKSKADDAKEKAPAADTGDAKPSSTGTSAPAKSDAPAPKAAKSASSET
jgi:putative FmdB family regulatory protein